MGRDCAIKDVVVVAGKSLWTDLEEAALLFQEQGFLLVEDVFAKTYLDKLHAAYVTRYLNTDGRVMNESVFGVGDRRRMFTVDMIGPFNDPLLYANPTLLPLIKTILGPTCVLDGFGSIVSFPGAKTQHIHRDQPLLCEPQELCLALPPYAITTVIPLIDFDLETGTTAIWPGSHRKPDPKQGGWEIDEAFVPTPSRGSAYLMDYRLVHAGTANLSQWPRPMLYVIYSRPWFVDPYNFSREPPIQISNEELQRVPDDARPLFAKRVRWF